MSPSRPPTANATMTESDAGSISAGQSASRKSGSRVNCEEAGEGGREGGREGGGADWEDQRCRRWPGGS